MPIYALGALVPDIHADAYVHPDAVVIGAVTIAAGASIWPTAVLRGDYGRIEIGEDISVQDGTVVHTTEDCQTLIGARCVVGHNAHLEGCVVGDDCLIGSGSTVLNRAVIAPGAAVAASALVTMGVHVPTGRIAVGVPAEQRPVPSNLRGRLSETVELYRGLGERYRVVLRRIP
jgi:carbonic anhydrase/acetyltransferase-like protein (isoleucine patch superfamily)